MMNTALAYARERATATRHAYIVSGMGHVWLDCPINRTMLDECGGLFAVVKADR